MKKVIHEVTTCELKDAVAVIQRVLDSGAHKDAKIRRLILELAEAHEDIDSTIVMVEYKSKEQPK